MVHLKKIDRELAMANRSAELANKTSNSNNNNNNNDSDVRIPLNPNSDNSYEDDEAQRPISNFLTSILNFNSLIPSNKEIDNQNNKNTQVNLFCC
jgi:hypothetical protein